MTKNFQRLWEVVANSSDEVVAIRTLADILVEKKGRAFVLGLDREDAENCIEILGRVSRSLRLPSFAVSDGSVRVFKVEISKRLPRNRLSLSR